MAGSKLRRQDIPIPRNKKTLSPALPSVLGGTGATDGYHIGLSPFGDLHALKVWLSEGEQHSKGDGEGGHQEHEEGSAFDLLTQHACKG